MASQKNKGGLLRKNTLGKLLELNYKKDEKVKISPIGRVVGLDGREFKIDADFVINSIVKNDVHIPLDENHSFAEAIGWFDKNSFENRVDGIYAFLEFNEKGKELSANKTYRYLSPVYEMGQNGKVIGIDSVGFVNRPNLLNKEINKKKETNKMENEELVNEIKSLKEEIASLKKADEPTGENNNDDAIAKEVNSLKDDLTVIKDTLKETNKKINVAFKKGEFDENDKKITLSENDKKVADLLGLSEEEYAKTKESK